MELMIVMLVMTFVSAAAFGMMTTVMGDSIKVQNKCDGIDLVRNAVEKMSRTIRMGRSFGDIFGEVVNVNINGTNYPVCSGSLSFPSNNDPIYANAAPPKGWPSWADGNLRNSFTLSSQCLIVQRPIFGANGFPLAIRTSEGNPSPASTACNVVTDVYMVLPDPNNPGEWVLQWAEFPGLSVSGYTADQNAQLGPTTICKGIIGPMAGGLPRVFRYHSRGVPGANPAPRLPGDGLNPAMDANNIGIFDGVEIELEMRSHSNSAQVNNQWIKDSVLAFKQQVFLRNNALASQSAPP